MPFHTKTRVFIKYFVHGFTTALTGVENKIPNVSNLVKKKLIVAQKLVKLKISKIKSIKNELNELSKTAKAILIKVLTKGLINKFSILNGAKYFLQEYFKII